MRPPGHGERPSQVICGRCRWWPPRAVVSAPRTGPPPEWTCSPSGRRIGKGRIWQHPAGIDVPVGAVLRRSLRWSGRTDRQPVRRRDSARDQVVEMSRSDALAKAVVGLFIRDTFYAATGVPMPALPGRPDLVGPGRVDGAELGGGRTRTGSASSFLSTDGRARPPSDRDAGAELDLGRDRLPDVGQPTPAQEPGRTERRARTGTDPTSPWPPTSRRGPLRRDRPAGPELAGLGRRLQRADGDGERGAVGRGTGRRSGADQSTAAGGADRLPGRPAVVDGRDVWPAGSPTSRRPGSSGRAGSGQGSSSSTAATSRTPASATIIDLAPWWLEQVRQRNELELRPAGRDRAHHPVRGLPRQRDRERFGRAHVREHVGVPGAAADDPARLRRSGRHGGAAAAGRFPGGRRPALGPECRSTAVRRLGRLDTPSWRKWRPRPVIVIHQPTVPAVTAPLGLDVVRSEHRHDGSLAGPAGRAGLQPIQRSAVPARLRIAGRRQPAVHPLKPDGLRSAPFSHRSACLRLPSRHMCSDTPPKSPKM